MFGVVYQADSVIQTDLEEWNRVANENVNQAVQALEEDSPLQRRIEQNARVVWEHPIFVNVPTRRQN